MEKHYFVRRGIETLGLIIASELEANVSSGEILTTGEVSLDIRGPWELVRDVPELAGFIKDQQLNAESSQPQSDGSSSSEDFDDQIEDWLDSGESSEPQWSEPPEPMKPTSAVSAGSQDFGDPHSSESIHSQRSRLRPGLPWDNRKGVDKAFWPTIKAVLNSPKNAFGEMRADDGIGNAIYFSVLGNVYGAVLVAVGVAVILAVLISLFSFSLFGADDLASSLPKGLGIAALFVASAAILGAINGLVFPLVQASILHVFLKLFRGADRGFATTVRVAAYLQGSWAAITPFLMIILIIPIVGELVGLVLGVVMVIYLINGLASAHGTSGGKAAAAVLVPQMLCSAAIAFLYLWFFFALFTGTFGEGTLPTSSSEEVP